jgi:beta-lactamase class A
MDRSPQATLAAAKLILAFVVAFKVQAADVQMKTSERVPGILRERVQQTVSTFSESRLKAEELAVTIVDLRDPDKPERAAHRGDIPIYPASVIKLFYLVAAHQWMEEGKIKEAPELRRAMRDMIVDSYNEATHYIIDLLTETTSGPELPEDQMKQWEFNRNAINRYFQSRGFADINANQKPWCEGPYGRERVFVGEKLTNRNTLTTDTTARLLSEIALGRAVSQKRSVEMLELMARDPFTPAKDPDDQAHGFTGSAIPNGGKLWSKAGWTSETRHDAAYVELPGGAKFVLVIFTVNHASERDIIPTLARGIISDIQK